MLTGSEGPGIAHFTISNAGAPPTPPTSERTAARERPADPEPGRGTRGAASSAPRLPPHQAAFPPSNPGREKEGVNLQPSAPPPLPAEIASPTSSPPELTCPWLQPPPPRTWQIRLQSCHRVSAFPLSGSKPFDPEACPWLSQPPRKVLGTEKVFLRDACATIVDRVGAGAEVCQCVAA